MLNKLSKFSYAATLYLKLGYYNIFLTDVENKVCRMIIPFVNYKHNCLPMGVCIAPDIFKEQMSSLMENLDFARVYLDNLLVITSSSFKEHLAKVK